MKTEDFSQRIFNACLLERHFYFRHLGTVRKSAEAFGSRNICIIYVGCSFEIASNMPAQCGDRGGNKAVCQQKSDCFVPLVCTGTNGMSRAGSPLSHRLLVLD